MFGDGRPYLVALLLPDLHAIRRGGGIGLEVRDVLGRVVAEVNRGAAPAERVRGFAVLPRDLRADEGELTPTLKARRHVCEDHFRDLIRRCTQTPGPGPQCQNATRRGVRRVGPAGASSARLKPGGVPAADFPAGPADPIASRP